jgi:phage shock protein C
MSDEGRKRCPYCAEEIRAEALKCRYCGSRVAERTAAPAGEGPLTNTWYRSRDEKMIAGVCGGLGEQFGISVTVVRLAFVLGMLIGGGMGLVIYLVLWAVMPYRPRPRLAAPAPPSADVRTT